MHSLNHKTNINKLWLSYSDLYIKNSSARGWFFMIGKRYLRFLLRMKQTQKYYSSKHRRGHFGSGITWREIDTFQAAAVQETDFTAEATSRDSFSSETNLKRLVFFNIKSIWVKSVKTHIVIKYLKMINHDSFYSHLNK